MVYSTIKSFIAKLSEIQTLGFPLLFLFICLSIAQGNLKLKFSSPPAFPHKGMFCWSEIFVPQENTIELILPLCTTTFLYPLCHLPLLPPCAFPQTCGVVDRNCKEGEIFQSARVIFFHPCRERSKVRKLFFFHGAEDVTLVNKNKPLLPMKGLNDPHIYPLRTVSCFVYSCCQQWVFFYNFCSQHWITGVRAFYWPKPERSQDMVLQRSETASMGSLHCGQLNEALTWTRRLDRSAKCICPDLKPFTYVG